MTIDKYLLIQLCALSAKSIDTDNLQTSISALSAKEKFSVLMKVQTLIFYNECMTSSNLRILKQDQL